jgi:hypothetical protein
MDDRIERAARAIGKRRYGYCSPDHTPTTWKMSVALARAALEAVAEPTAEMDLTNVGKET